MNPTALIILLCLVFGAYKCADPPDDDSDNSLSDEEFEPEFEVTKTKFKSGKRKGEEKILVSLLFGPYTFRKKVERGCIYTFVCKSCEELGKNIIAKAESADGENFIIISMPHPVSHDCSPSSACIWARKCIQAMKRAVRNDPTRAIPTIYEQCKSEVSRTLTQDQKIAFLSELSPFCAIKASLYRIRRERIPGGPERQVSIFFSQKVEAEI